MRYLIFDYNAKGHHIEYIHHIAHHAAQSDLSNEYIFVLSPDFKNKWMCLEWPITSNIEYIFFSGSDNSEIQSKSLHFARSKILCKILKINAQIIDPNKILLIDLLPYMPCLPFYFKRKRYINGIIYKIPRYRPQQSFSIKIRDYIMMSIFAKSKIFNHLFLLNDELSPAWYNDRFKTKVFCYLPDPINIKNNTITALDKYKGKITLVHAGGLGERKGTFKILEALRFLPREEHEKFRLNLVGAVSNIIEREKLLDYIHKFENQIEISFSNRFVSFDELLKEIQNGDYLLIPYDNCEQSSGILGYAAYYHKPVIGPCQGLLGQLISKYQLGISLPDNSPQIIAQTLRKLPIMDEYSTENDTYVQTRSIEIFTKMLLKD